MSEQYKKTPSGVTPKKIWEQQCIDSFKEKRLEELKRAINEYSKNNLVVPFEWLEEYNALVNKDYGIYE